MQVKSIAECSKGSILQYFRPSLSYHMSLRSLFCLFLSGRLKQVLLLYLFVLKISGFFFASSSYIQVHFRLYFFMEANNRRHDQDALLGAF